MGIVALFSTFALGLTNAIDLSQVYVLSSDAEKKSRSLGHRRLAGRTSITHSQFFRDETRSQQTGVRYEIASRIYGGVEAPFGRYPYIAILSRNVSPGVGMPVCSGSLISPNTILTAAHCIGLVDTIWLGVEDINMLQDGVYEMYNISNPILSPIFNNSDVDNDFAILLLDKPSSFQPIRFNMNITLPQGGDDVFVIGWGQTESGNESPVPREANLIVLSNSECASMYAPYANITGSMMCASGGSQRDACQGDSGGPLIIKGRNSTSDILVGMVSWGFDCADPRFPGVYSRIAATASWLKHYIA